MVLRSSTAVRKPHVRNDAAGGSKARRTEQSGPSGNGSAAANRRAGASKERRRGTGYVLEEQVGFQLRLAMQRHTAIFVEGMIGAITQTQFATLVKLYDVGPCAQNQLARLVALDPATINGVLERLRRRGFVESEPDPTDGRQRVAALTPKGRETMMRAIKVAAQITEDTLVPLTPAERKQLSLLLKKIS